MSPPSSSLFGVWAQHHLEEGKNFLYQDQANEPPFENPIPLSGGGRLCPVCGRYISNPSNLRKHIHRAHGTRSFSCLVCGKSYRVLCDLRRHLLAAHNFKAESMNNGKNNSLNNYMSIASDLAANSDLLSSAVFMEDDSSLTANCASNRNDIVNNQDPLSADAASC